MDISEIELITIVIFIICVTVIVKNLEFLTRRGYKHYLSFRDVKKFEERLEKLEMLLAELKIKEVEKMSCDECGKEEFEDGHEYREKFSGKLRWVCGDCYGDIMGLS